MQRHVSTPTSGLPIALLASLLIAPATAQERRPAALEVSLPAPPIATETVAGGEVTMVPFSATDRGVPLPLGRVAVAGEKGDELQAERSGDPYFLGFAAGPYYPPAGERIDPLLLEQVASLRADGRPNVETYAFVMFAERMQPEHTAALAAAGARVIEFHPHYCLKVALTPEAIEAVAALPCVRWVGAPRPWQKQHPLLEREIARAGGEVVEVFVNVYDSDLGDASTFEVFGSGSLREADGQEVAIADQTLLPKRWHSRGWQERALTLVGSEVVSYSDRVRAFRVRLAPARIAELVELDFVQFVEPAFEIAPTHDESMPMINADRNRATWDGGTSSSAIVGVVDSGIDSAHTGLNHFSGWGWDMTGGTGGAWTDYCGHGSHVTGTILGDPIASLDSFTGAAPGVGTWGPTGRVFNVRLFYFCSGSNVDMSALLALLHTDVTDGNGIVTPKPHVINSSWGGTSDGPYFGTESDARELDWDVYLYNQLHVFAAGNSGPGDQTLTLQASAKNTLGVGNVNTHQNATYGGPGNPSTSSSRGPTADLRWGPQLCAPGVLIDSVEAGTNSGYIEHSGTSMATPHVVGVAAQLLDEHPFLRYNAATLSAVLMAGTLTKDSTLLTAPSTSSSHHLNIYGTGRIDAVKARGGNSQQSTYFWGFTQGATGYGQVEFPVNAGATQVTVVMHYKERAASSGASKALVNDLDLWIDPAPFATGGNSGDYFAQQSARDNTEIRIINNPSVANWRLKVFPENATTGSYSSSNVGLCVIVTYGDVTPNATMALEVPSYAKPNQLVDVTASVYNPSYYASAVYLETNDSGNTLTEAKVTLGDGIVADLIGNDHAGRKVMLGDIKGLTEREVRWKSSWATEGLKSITVIGTADNIEPSSVAKIGFITIDGTPPAGPTQLASTTHTVGVSSCASSIGFSWTKATDPLSGLNGYRMEISSSPLTVPTSTALNVAVTDTTYNTTLAPGTWYAHLRAMDEAGNWGTTQHAGPFIHSPGVTSVYCVAAPNSVGPGAQIGSTGSLSVAANAFTLTCTGLPANKACIFFYAKNAQQVAFGNGFLCITSGVVRLPGLSTGNGSISYTLDIPNLPPSGQITGGSTYRFQNWYRDPSAGGLGFNLSNALSATYCP